MEKTIVDKKGLSNKLNNFFVKIGANLVEKIKPSKYCFKRCIASINAKLPEKTGSVTELKKPMFSFKFNKSPGIHEVQAPMQLDVVLVKLLLH